MPPLVLEIESISKRYGGVQALSAVTARLEGPGIIGLIGPNGSGKSTLLGVLCGLVQPTTGSVAFDGRPLPLGSSHRVARRGVSRAFQAARLIPDLLAWENICVAMTGGRRAELRARSAEIAEALDLGHVLDAWPDQLTAAERRRLQVASAVASDSRVLLLDEPAAGLTGAEAHALGEAVTRLASDALVVIVEHNMQVIYSLASRVLVLIDGELAADGPPEAITADARVQAAYLGVAATEAAA
ncbi:ABC transporter ATP-binding protein [Conexibacter sp. CPCC 206217]|uniref:ABC transporter ATP-binding protein n=1 Tax=Conexibacter sp. CPCC 206217 TaxID=3064574 RepID=UPI00272377AF|nr:ATP-binding cassette domain-containing protein [Conexibacter sp. CPCC 206217]MDO8210123.1 ATP-binding cassette domain-containing protein [Conexibacter sp. CPCC 206217]